MCVHKGCPLSGLLNNQTDCRSRDPHCTQGSVLRIQYAVWTQPGMEPGGFEKDNQASPQCPCLTPCWLVPLHIKPRLLDAGRALFRSAALAPCQHGQAIKGFRGLS